MTDWARLESVFALGTRQQALPEDLPDGADALAALSLLGQVRRLRPTRPTAAVSTDRRLPDDPRPMLDHATRTALIRLANLLDGTDRTVLASRLLGAIAEAGFRPHVFDLEAIEPLLRSAATCLGRAERAFLGRAPVSGTDDAVLALRQARAVDPAAARVALAERFASEPAARRAELVGCLRTGLSAGDQPFLEAAAANRALAVRQQAEPLLALLPGTAQYEERLAQARACLRLETAGLLRRRRQLVLKPPPGGKAALSGHFDGLALSALVAPLGISVADVPDLAAGTPGLLTVLAQAALQEADIGTAAALLRLMDNPARPGDLLALAQDWTLLRRESRHALAEACLRPDCTLTLDRHAHAFGTYLGGGMRDTLARAVLACPGWSRFTADTAEKAGADEKFKPDPLLLSVASLFPVSLHGSLAIAFAADRYGPSILSCRPCGGDRRAGRAGVRLHAGPVPGPDGRRAEAGGFARLGGGCRHRGDPSRGMMLVAARPGERKRNRPRRISVERETREHLSQHRRARDMRRFSLVPCFVRCGTMAGSFRLCDQSGTRQIDGEPPAADVIDAECHLRGRMVRPRLDRGAEFPRPVRRRRRIPT